MPKLHRPDRRSPIRRALAAAALLGLTALGGCVAYPAYPYGGYYGGGGGYYAPGYVAAAPAVVVGGGYGYGYGGGYGYGRRWR